MCVVSLSLKMWIGRESVMCVLERVGLVKKIEPEDYERLIMRMVFSFFIAVQICRLLYFWLEIWCSIIFHKMMDLLNVISRFFSGPPPVLPISDEPQAELDPVEMPTETPPPVLPMSDEYEVEADLDSVEVPTETPPSFVSDEYRVKMERLVKKAEKIAEESNQDIPQAYLCPIGGTVMVTPVITGTGHTYDMELLSRWFQEKNTCPCTGEQTRIVARNLVLEGLIEKWAEDVIANHTNVHESMSIVEPQHSSDLRQDVIANHTNVHASMSIVEPQHSSDLRQGVTRIRAAAFRVEDLGQALARIRGAVTGSESHWVDDNESEDYWYPRDA